MCLLPESGSSLETGLDICCLQQQNAFACHCKSNAFACHCKSNAFACHCKSSAMEIASFWDMSSTSRRFILALSISGLRVTMHTCIHAYMNSRWRHRWYGWAGQHVSDSPYKSSHICGIHCQQTSFCQQETTNSLQSSGTNNMQVSLWLWLWDWLLSCMCDFSATAGQVKEACPWHKAQSCAY